MLLIASATTPPSCGPRPPGRTCAPSPPIPASSGRVARHRLNRGGDRQANHALWRIVITRMSAYPQTRAYVARRTAEGMSKKEIIRCLMALRRPRGLPPPARLASRSAGGGLTRESAAVPQVLAF